MADVIPTSDGGINVERVPTRNSQLTIDERASRRASIASAVTSIQKFKESWISIMFLKASIGLGQVIVLVTLLILASVLDSPLAPFHKQSAPSDACPNPALFQSWMIVQIFRLIICWSLSCWYALRRQRAARAEEMATHSEEARIDNIHQTPRGQQSVPSLTHSASSYTTDATLTNPTPNDPTTPSPATSYPPTAHSRSSGSVDALGGRQPDMTPYWKPMRHYGMSQELANELARGNTNLALARAEYRAEENHERPDYTCGLVDKLEVIAPWATKGLGASAVILFILGNVLLFYPLPSKQETCYHASPMLWWGVMAVTGVGWFLVGQVLVVVLIIGVGGPLILNLLRRLPCFPAAVEPEPERPPRPDPLTPAELEKIRVVCFVPEPDPEAPTPEYLPDPQSGISFSMWSMAHFPYTPYIMEPDSTCAICTDNFTEPQVANTMLFQVDRLRLLHCGHVYHADCIDRWLVGTSGICPFCNRGVREPPATADEESDVDSGEKPDRRRWFGSRAPASSAALASATA